MNDDISNDISYSMKLANDSYEWYKGAAIRSRRAFRRSETALLIISASIPVAAAISPHNAIAPAILGAAVVILSGLRTLFHWHENYLRFSAARESIESERRLYRTGVKPYDDPLTRDQNLAASVTHIERDEMASWTKIAAERPRA